MRGVGGPSVLTQLLVANYKFVEKHEDGHAWLEDWEPAPEARAAPPIEKVCTVLRDVAPDEER